MEAKIIGITGKIGAGKDTLASCILSEIENKFLSENGQVQWAVVMHFADSLKKVVHTITSRVPSKTQEGKMEPIPLFGMSERELLQVLGTDVLRDKFDKDIWIKSLQSRLESAYGKEGKGIVIIADVRFENEAKWIKDNGGILIGIDRKSNPHQQSSHHSELQDLEMYKDYRVENDGSFADLCDMAVILTEYIERDFNLKREVNSKIDMISSVNEWMREFLVFSKSKDENFSLYSKLIEEELRELKTEWFNRTFDKSGFTAEERKKAALEAADLIWVAIGTALSIVSEGDIKDAFAKVLKSNMSKCFDIEGENLSEEELTAYERQFSSLRLMETFSGKNFYQNESGKIMKGPRYKKPEA